MIDMFSISSGQYSNRSLHMTVEHLRNVANVTKEPNFYFYLIITNLNLVLNILKLLMDKDYVLTHLNNNNQ